MASKINISIPEPCHENWQKMTPTEKGRFCDSCQKNVFDFTKASDRQIIEAYHKNQNLCGRFLNTQLDRDLIAPKEKSSIWMATTSAVISFLALGNQEVTAQETVKTDQTDQKVLLGEPAVDNNQEKEITGVVTDEFGPLPGAFVVIRGTQRGVETNFDGTFKIKANEGEILLFSFMGYDDVIKTVNQSNTINAILQESTVLGGEIYITTGMFKRPNFFKRTLHRIGNWFK